MIDRDEAESALARRALVVAASGVAVGRVERLIADEDTGLVLFVTLDLDRKGRQETFIAVHSAHVERGQIVVPYRLDRILNSPRFPAGEGLASWDKAELLAYHGATTT